MNQFVSFSKGSHEFILDPYRVRQDTFRFFMEKYQKLWEKDIFDLYDHICSPHLDFIDIGGWNGCTAIYTSRISRCVYSIEASPENFNELTCLSGLNANNIIALNKAVTNGSQPYVHFGMNPDPQRAHDSSQNSIRYTPSNSVSISSITLADILNLQRDWEHISIIKIDIEGGEEDLIKDIFSLTHLNRLVSFHVWAWKDKTISTNSQRLPHEVLEILKSNPGATIYLPKLKSPQETQPIVLIGT